MIFDTNIHSTSDARHLAKKHLPWMVFDYIDGAAGEGYGEALNRETIQHIRLRPRILNNVEHRDLSDIILRSGFITGMLVPLIAISVVMQQILSLLGAKLFVTDLLANLGGYYCFRNTIYCFVRDLLHLLSFLNLQGLHIVQ